MESIGGTLPVFFCNLCSIITSGIEKRLDQNIQNIYQILDEMRETEVFEPHMRKWADNSTKTAVWEVYKFIHVNTVAPFTTFRTKIRKWKRLML